MKQITHHAFARWEGGRTGSLTTENGVLSDTRFSLGISSNSDPATNPGELIAAAHAGSFSMALSNELKLAGTTSGNIVTTATVTLENMTAGWTILNIHLNVTATLPKVTQGEFIDATLRAKTNCLVSRLLRANISLNAKLENKTHAADAAE